MIYPMLMVLIGVAAFSAVVFGIVPFLTAYTGLALVWVAFLFVIYWTRK